MIHPVSKICIHCKLIKLLEEFGIESRNKDGRRSICYLCRRLYRKRIYNSISNRTRALKHLYGISIKDYENLLNKQNNKCLICGEEKSLYVDHDHKTGKIRGLICHACNLGLGFFRDNINRLNQAISYLHG